MEKLRNFSRAVVSHVCFKYPPAQGLVLALGQLLGDTWIGVLLSAAAMAAAFVWALQAWIPARWRFSPAFSRRSALRRVLLDQQLLGGAVAAVGGALVLGAFGRIRRRPSLAMGILLALA